MPEKLELPGTRSNFRVDWRSYRELLTEEEKQKISELFREEIALLGYEN